MGDRNMANGLEKSVYIPITKAGDARECVNSKTIAPLILHASNYGSIKYIAKQNRTSHR